ncbi:MAG: GIY-YIG nuclease family protein [Pseudomonadota bacterium]|nr:GIY-YIG nuclease family protein [Pseudomonadota bacterium]
MTSLYFVYVLGSTNKNKVLTYVGWTINLENRLNKHNSGKGARFTRGRKWRLLYAEKHKSQREAMKREWHLKRDRKFRRIMGECCQ